MRNACGMGLAVLVMTSTAFGAWGATKDKKPESAKSQVEADGSVQVPGFTLPFSELASPEAKAQLIEFARRRASLPRPNVKDIAAFRKATDEMNQPVLDRQTARYAVTREPRTIGGIYTEVFTPKEGVDPKNKKRVLINLHGGGFIQGAKTVGAIESIPIASVGKITVISVDYRMAPEHKFPAASEDVAAVYKELLKEYKPADIGIYGCSAGGILAGEAIAWFQKVGLPNPAAIGIFCASTGEIARGDSAWFTPMLGSMLPSPKMFKMPYFADTAPDDPLAYPEVSPALLAKFPPTLFITATRGGELSSAVHSHIQMLKAGVDAEIAIWDGLDHAFLNNPDLPESREAYDVIVKFFDKHLGQREGLFGWL